LRKLLKNLLVPATALVLLAVLAGCGGTAASLPKDPAQFTDQNVRDIVAAAVDNVLQAFSFTGTYVSTGAYSSGDQSSLASSASSLNATMLSDRENGRAQITLGIGITPTNPSSGLSPMQLDVDTYLYADYLYVHLVTIPDLPWYKVPVTDSVLDLFSTRLFDNEVRMFGLPASVSYLRNESYDGTDCYVINVVPNADQLLAMARRDAPQGAGIDWSRLGDITQVYRNVSYTAWIAADSLRFLKVTSHVEMDLGSAGAFMDDPSFSDISLTSDGSMLFTDYNKKVVINLPEDARQAQEVSPAQFAQDTTASN
jgi:hypothetical protein